MSGIAPVSAHSGVSSSISASVVGGVGGNSSVATTAEIGAPQGALGLQLAGSLSAASGSSTIDPMATLALALLMSRGNETQDKNDPWKALASLALMSGAMGQQSLSVTMSVDIGSAQQAYGADAAAGVAGANLSAQV